MSNIKLTEPWWFTDKILRDNLSRAVPYLNGHLLDAGCGSQPYRDLLNCDSYVGMEFSDKFSPDVIGDVRNLEMFGDATFDSILCNQVLEHVDDVEKALKELSRVLRPGGHICLTVPFIARVHGSPNDYWRFSKFGIEYILKKSGFEIVFIKPMGGFITTQCYLWLFYIYEKMQGSLYTRLFNKLFSFILNPIFLFFHKLDKDTLTPFNYIAVAKKPLLSCDSNITL